MNTNTEFYYFHGRDENEKINARIKQFGKAGATVTRPDFCASIQRFAQYLTCDNLNKPLVLLVHHTPLANSQNWINGTMLEQAKGSAGKLYVVLIAGGGVQHSEASTFINIARKKFFGGFDYFKHEVDGNNVELLGQMFLRIKNLFSEDSSPTFDQFAVAVQPPDEHVATKIQQQFIRVFGRRCFIIELSKSAVLEKTFENEFGKLNDTERKSLAVRLQKYEELDAERAQLRHNSLSNGVMRSISAKVSVIKGEASSKTLIEDIKSLVNDGNQACKDANRIAQKWKDIGKELNQLGAATILKELCKGGFHAQDLFSSEAATILKWSGQLENNMMEISGALKNVKLDTIDALGKGKMEELLKNTEASCSGLISALELQG